MEAKPPSTTSVRHARALPEPNVGVEETERLARAPVQPIPSGKLLLGRTSVTIDHEGTQYVLRATRAGKLILTK